MFVGIVVASLSGSSGALATPSGRASRPSGRHCCALAPGRDTACPPLWRGGRADLLPAVLLRRLRGQMLHEHSELVELPIVTHDVLEAKMHIPLLRSGSVSRTPLVNRLRASSAGKVVTVLAPVGYGKTTVLAQWAARDRRPFVWLSIDEDDNDPVILSRVIASALTRGLPPDRLVLQSLGSPGESAPHSRRRLTAAFRSNTAAVRPGARQRPCAPVEEMRSGGRVPCRGCHRRGVVARARRPGPAAAPDRPYACCRSTLRGRRRGARAEPPRGRSRGAWRRSGARSGGGRRAGSSNRGLARWGHFSASWLSRKDPRHPRI